ncbi:MAG: DUF6498-containing protein [Patescibacteria group bacterium]
MKSTSITSLVLVNLIPVFGVLFLGWNLGQILVLYWSENLVIGILNILKILRAKGVPKPGSPATLRVNGKPVNPRSPNYSISLASFFALHYGIFTAGHGVFVFTYFAQNYSLGFTELFWGFCSLFVSHWISYRVNYIGSGEYLKATPDSQMLQPYKRIIILHLTIILGGAFIQNSGVSTAQSIIPLLVLVGVKTFIDVSKHIAEHTKFLKPAV